MTKFLEKRKIDLMINSFLNLAGSLLEGCTDKHQHVKKPGVFMHRFQVGSASITKASRCETILGSVSRCEGHNRESLQLS